MSWWGRAVLPGLLALAGCAAATPDPGPTPTQVPPVAETPPEPLPVVAPQPADACGAEAVRHLIGRPRSEIPVPVRPNLQRVACTTCPVTLDFNPNRLNFFFDADTGIIKEIRCG